MVILYYTHAKNARPLAKESLSEYGSGWEWDSTWPHVFDYEKKYTYKDTLGQIHTEYYPMRYINSINITTPTVSGTWVNYGTSASSTTDTNNCPVNRTNGEILYSGHFMTSQISCEPHAYNAGNIYNLPSQLGDAKYNNICPKGWMLPDNNGETSYSNLLIAYGINHNAGSNKTKPYDVALLNMPLSFLRSGYLSDGTLKLQGNYGRYRMASLSLYFSSGALNPTYDTHDSYGYSVRCVSR